MPYLCCGILPELWSCKKKSVPLSLYRVVLEQENNHWAEYGVEMKRRSFEQGADDG